MPQRLPRFARSAEAAEDLRRLGEILVLTGVALPDEPLPALPGGDARQLRGLPVVAKGVPGTAAGTDPLAEVIWAESRRDGKHGRR